MATIKTQDEVEALKILICLPSMRIVPSMMNLTQMLLQCGKQIDFTGLRLLELGQRRSKVMMATESSRTLQSDPVINIFRTFGELNRRPLNTLIAISTHSNFANDVIEAATDLESDLVIFPINHSNATYPRGWAKNVAESLWQDSVCPTVLFVERGFGISSLDELSHDQFISSPGESQRILFLFSGSEDDVEASVLLNYLVHASSLTVTILVIGEIDALSNQGIALDSLQSFPNVTTERNVPSSAMSLISRAAKYGPKDLIAVSHSLYFSSSSTDSLLFWLDHASKSSYMVVKKPAAQALDLKKKRQPSNRPQRRRSLSEVIVII
jgi:hypothetical protein